MDWLAIAIQQRQRQQERFATYSRCYGEARLRQCLRMMNTARVPVRRTVQ